MILLLQIYGIERSITEFSRNQQDRNKSILFLWEDLNANGTAPYFFTKNALHDFFNDKLNWKNKFGVAVFNRGSNVLDMLVDSFTSNKKYLLNAIESYNHNTVSVKEQPQYSDLYKAIHKGIDLLKEQPQENVKAIFVFTSGWNLKGGGATSEAGFLTARAKENHIPIYVVLYPIHGNDLEITDIAHDTYGKTLSWKHNSNIANQIYDCYLNINQLHSPHEYTFCFETDKKQNAQLHNIVLLANGIKQARYTFTAPSFSLVAWVQNNVMLSSITILFLIVLIFLAVYLFKKKEKEKKIKIKSELESVRQNADIQSNAARQEVERIRQEQLIYQQKQENEKRRAELQVEQERLIRLMQNKNLFPRLQCKTGNDSFIYTVNKIKTTLGRESDNDVVFNHQTTSRYHAEIVFNGCDFEIIDKGSTNKVILNGQFIKRATLKSGDTIGLGEVTITFYM